MLLCPGPPCPGPLSLGREGLLLLHTPNYSGVWEGSNFPLLPNPNKNNEFGIWRKRRGKRMGKQETEKGGAGVLPLLSRSPLLHTPNKFGVWGGCSSSSFLPLPLHLNQKQAWGLEEWRLFTPRHSTGLSRGRDQARGSTSRFVALFLGSSL